MDFANKRVLVIGLGKSGQAASLKLKSLGASVLAADTSQTEEMRALADELRAKDIGVVLGKQEKSLLGGVDMLVVSPGVPSRVEVIEEAKARALPVLSEIELAFQLTKKPVIAITGTNGKTTTTTVIGKVFELAGKLAAVAGNIGTPLVLAVDNPDIETLIVEVSSFQLDAIADFRPRVAVLLNITEDHLDWHPDFNDYVRAKARLFINQKESDFAVLNLDDSAVSSLASNIKAQVIGTSKNRELSEGVFIKDGRIVAKIRGAAIDICATSELKLLGSHNLDNVMAVVAACLVSDIDAKSIKETLTSFSGLSHRLEYVASPDQVSYYDDSKATNVDATIKALTAFDGPVILLVGGRNKGNSFEPLAQSIDQRVKAIVGFGEAGREILDAMPSGIPQEYAKTVREAVLQASRLAEPGEVVLFSPACASFDEFQSYAQRGDVFKKAVLELGEANGEKKD